MRISNIGFFIILQLLGLTLWLLNSHATVVHSQNVEYLPGFDGPLPFSLETGYIGMDKGEVQLFYYFFESENNPKQDPVILWLTGGPLCSAMSAILYEIGPIQLEEVDNIETIPKLFLRQYAWTKTASILFVDFPAGAGFSYAETSRANYSGDFKASHNINQFLRKGYILGNPATDRFIDSNYQVPFAHGMGLISDEQYEKEGYLVAKHWMNQKSVQKALHVRKETIGNWIRCNYKFNYSYEVPSSVPYHVKISAKGFRSLIYSGDHDMIVPFLGTQAWIRSLNYSIIDDWRKWLVDSQIAGLLRSHATLRSSSILERIKQKASRVGEDVSEKSPTVKKASIPPPLRASGVKRKLEAAVDLEAKGFSYDAVDPYMDNLFPSFRDCQSSQTFADLSQEAAVISFQARCQSSLGFFDAMKKERDSPSDRLKATSDALKGERAKHKDCRSELDQVKSTLKAAADGSLDMDSYYLSKARPEIMEEFQEGKHEAWDYDAKKAAFE
uniref:Uncharacterized protein n=1 Tax=Chenopodium quinoa TaxID=63459 RepID=A0A803MRC5_CHEQI